MKCALCATPIEQYNATLHHLELNEHRAVDLCQPCIDKIVKWEGQKIAALFPTRALKKRFGDKRKEN